MNERIPDLSAYRGWYAQLWDYSVSHRWLTIRFSSSERAEIYLVARLCRRISADSGWVLVDPRIEERGDALAFVDNGIDIEFEFVHLTQRSQ
ncbi:MAG TPA: hypothetical protein VGL61_03620 [Kofleriaceae bacterium]